MTRDFLSPLNYFFTYRTGKSAVWQDAIYTHKTEPWKNIVVVEIDEETINAIQSESKWQSLGISKKEYISILKSLLEADVKAVGLDIIFQDPDPAYEKEFSELLQKHKNIIIGTSDITLTEESRENGSFLTRKDCLYNDYNKTFSCEGLPNSLYIGASWGLVNIGEGNIHSATRESRSIRTLGEKLTMYDAIDDANREWKTNFKNLEKKPIYSLPLAMLESAGNENVKKILQKNDTHMLQPFFSRKESEIPLYTKISFIQLLNYPQAFSEILKDSYVLVGESGKILHDRLLSPASNEYIAGVYTHAFVLDSVLQNKIFEKIPSSIFLVIIVILTTIFVSVYFFAPKFLSPIIFLVAMVLSIFFTRFLYDTKYLVIDIFPIFLASGVLTFPLTYIYKFFIVEKDKRFIMNTFSRYISPEVVKQIDANKIEATLGGEKKELSILFSDIAGFTSISEKMDTKDLFALMTKYLSVMTDILVANNGTLDKYIGDAVMGFYGAPVDNPRHAFDACKTALWMQKALGQINLDLQKDGFDSISFRVGIATGEVMVGNIWSEKRFNYTVLGDSVNLSSRLEWMGKEYGVKIIIAESTAEIIKDFFILRELDYIAVKGKSEWVRIFELLWEKWENIETEIVTKYHEALRLYRAGEYLQAWQIWEKLMTIDPPSWVMALRCLSLLKWETHLENGVYHMTHK